LAIGESEQISCHPHLPIALIASADPDHRKGETGAKLGGKGLWNVLNHQGKASPRFQREGLLLQPLLGKGIGGLPPQTQAMHRLGRQTQVAHHRDPHPHHAINRDQGFWLSPLQLHGRCWTFLQHSPSGGHGVIQAALIAQEGQITNHKGRLPPNTPQTPTDRTAVVQHLLEGDRQRGVVAKHRHGQRIPHQHGIHPGLAHDGRRKGIPGGEDRDGETGLFTPEKIARALRQGGGRRWEPSLLGKG
jgi:hypothetical protein